MKTKSILLAALALGLTSTAFPQGTTAFTYQGRLNGSGGPVTGSYDLLGTTDGQPLVVKANNVGINTNSPQAALPRGRITDLGEHGFEESGVS